MGVTAALLARNGIEVYGDEELTMANLTPYLAPEIIKQLGTNNLAIGD